MRYSDEELSLIKGAFAENDDALKALRKHFLQLPLSTLDQAMLAPIKKEKALLDLIRKTLLPTLDGDAPFHQIIDLWMTIELKDRATPEAIHNIESRIVLMDYLDQQLSLLEGKGKEKIRFEDLIKRGDKNDKEYYVDVSARMSIIAHVEIQLAMFEILAGQKAETVEQTRKRLEQDSTK